MQRIINKIRHQWYHLNILLSPSIRFLSLLLLKVTGAKVGSPWTSHQSYSGVKHGGNHPGTPLSSRTNITQLLSVSHMQNTLNCLKSVLQIKLDWFEKHYSFSIWETELKKPQDESVLWHVEALISNRPGHKNVISSCCGSVTSDDVHSCWHSSSSFSSSSLWHASVWGLITNYSPPHLQLIT